MQRNACAKVNLSLHITGRRADGYHLLDSIVAFAQDAYDTLSIAPAETLAFTMEGGSPDIPMADNLVMKAARALHTGKGADITLIKHLPSGGGIGGGSTDAAAALHLLNEHWQLGHTEERLREVALTLGADVPVCVHGRGARMQGIGEIITPLSLPPLFAVLANPGVHVDTRAIFAQGIPAADGIPPQGGSTLPAWLTAQRNDLEPYAIKLAPAIGDALEGLRAAPGCWLARMSGSGSTCFGLFPTREAAHHAATGLRTRHPGWWITSTTLV